VNARADKIELLPLYAPKTCDVFADILREKIMAGELQDGDSLPPERVMVERTGISRASVREAIRLLEADGLIRTRAGRNGGAVVHQPNANIMVRPIELLLRGQRIPFRSVLETREAIEPASAGLAATYRTDEDLKILDAICSKLENEIEDEKQFLNNNLDWHMAVVAASHNELLIGFVKALSKTIHAATDVEDFNSLDSRKDVSKVHMKITDAIRSGDAAAAKRRMERHVNAYSERVLKYAPPAKISLR